MARRATLTASRRSGLRMARYRHHQISRRSRLFQEWVPPLKRRRHSIPACNLTHQSASQICLPSHIWLLCPWQHTRRRHLRQCHLATRAWEGLRHLDNHLVSAKKGASPSGRVLRRLSSYCCSSSLEAWPGTTIFPCLRPSVISWASR